MQRIIHLLNALQTNWSEDPAARGAAKITAGTILIAEGLFGVIRSNRITRGGTRGTGSLMGSFIGIIVGLVFVIVGISFSPSVSEDEVLVQGSIVDLKTIRDREGKIIYAGHSSGWIR